MGTGDYLILAGIALLTGLSLFRCWKNCGKGCSGSCAGCKAACRRPDRRR